MGILNSNSYHLVLYSDLLKKSSRTLNIILINFGVWQKDVDSLIDIYVNKCSRGKFVKIIGLGIQNQHRQNIKCIFFQLFREPDYQVPDFSLFLSCKFP